MFNVQVRVGVGLSGLVRGSSLKRCARPTMARLTSSDKCEKRTSNLDDKNEKELERYMISESWPANKVRMRHVNSKTGPWVNNNHAPTSMNISGGIASKFDSCSSSLAYIEGRERAMKPIQDPKAST